MKKFQQKQFLRKTAKQTQFSLASLNVQPWLMVDCFTSRLVGDVLLATGFLSYSGPFNQEFRDLLTGNWKKEMRKTKIPFSEVCKIDMFCLRVSIQNPLQLTWRDTIANFLCRKISTRFFMHEEETLYILKIYLVFSYDF